MFNRVKALAGKPNWTELYVGLLIAFGLPFIIYMFTNIEIAFAVFVLIQILLGLFKLRTDGAQ